MRSAKAIILSVLYFHSCVSSDDCKVDNLASSSRENESNGPSYGLLM